MNAMLCPSVETLEAFVHGNVDDDGLDSHLEQCSECRAAVEERDVSVNRPFSGLRHAAPVAKDLQKPAYLNLVSRAKAIVAAPQSGAAITSFDVCDTQPLGIYLLLETIG